VVSSPRSMAEPTTCSSTPCRSSASTSPSSKTKTTWTRGKQLFAPTPKHSLVKPLPTPKSTSLDISGVADVAHKNGLPLIVDNTVASPYLLRPLEHGADIVVHSATKFLGGHGTVIAGAIVDGGKFPWSKHVEKFPGLTEPDPSYHGASYTGVWAIRLRTSSKLVCSCCVTWCSSLPDNAFGLIQGIETLSLRMERHCSNALAVAKWLEAHDQVASVNYAALPSSPWFTRQPRRYAPLGVGLCCPLKSRVA
jgi:O-acetylhomoserine (thiol)-lyase